MKSRQVISIVDVTHLIEFMVACIVVGLEYMHNNGVIHRDIKPENLVMENNGYVRITDLGIARIWSPENSQDTSGTPGYMGNQKIGLIIESS
jgi:serine/threonine protein kinase